MEKDLLRFMRHLKEEASKPMPDPRTFVYFMPDPIMDMVENDPGFCLSLRWHTPYTPDQMKRYPTMKEF